MLNNNFSPMTLFFENLTLEYGDPALPWHVCNYSVTGRHIPGERDPHLVFLG
jgi:hypothetical protein